MIETTSQTGGTPRIAAFDHVRAIAVLAMIVSHVTVMFGTANACMTPIGRFMNEFCGTAPAAPVFMILMGIFFIYPHDKSFSQKMARG
ncbi:MAG TPA: heparan-alpha-glucosaminide N-acetyltransferase domain-containing protein, partial [Candidatus Ozemobacteraceae bacterium]|nr:heparan-alpha-glucosaminide N-acetyltransferase domain-containing protein [Candidatus Ozemobacteraceae bacterium]